MDRPTCGGGRPSRTPKVDVVEALSGTRGRGEAEVEEEAPVVECGVRFQLDRGWRGL